MAATHLLVEVLKVGGVMRRRDRRILLVTRPLVIELQMLLARSDPVVIAIIVHVLR